MTTMAITANRLEDGRVVYLTQDGRWSARFAAARLFDDRAAAEALLAGLAAGPLGRQVVGAYVFHVAGAGGAPVPAGQRETIRSRGPSVRADLGSQAGNG